MQEKDQILDNKSLVCHNCNSLKAFNFLDQSKRILDSLQATADEEFKGLAIMLA